MITKKKIAKKDRQTCLISGLISSGILIASNISFSPSIDIVVICINLLSGFLIGSIVPAAYIYSTQFLFRYINIKMLPYYIYIFVHIVTLIIVTFFIYILVGMIFFLEHVWEPLNMQIAVVLSFVFAIIFTLDSMLKQFLGKKFLKDIVSGKYYKPKEEKRIFAFIDLCDSTKWAEKLNHDSFFRLINDFLWILDRCAYYYDGEIYKYLGDGVIIVWKCDAQNYQNVHGFLVELHREIDRKNVDFEKNYGKRIQFTMGMHEGNVLIGELGDTKKEIGYWGDTVNTVQRIQNACKNYCTSVLLSEPLFQHLLDNIKDMRSITYKRVEQVNFKGKQQTMNVIKLELNQ